MNNSYLQSEQRLLTLRRVIDKEPALFLVRKALSGWCFALDNNARSEMKCEVKCVFPSDAQEINGAQLCAAQLVCLLSSSAACH